MDIQIYFLSEQAITVSFGNEINADLAETISTYNFFLHANPFPGFRTTVPAYCTLTVFYNPLVAVKADLKGSNSFDKVSNYLKSIHIKKNQAVSERKKITIPVYYGGDYGPDLEEVAAYTKLSIAEIINFHSSAIYKVFMIGFVPGFAYLGGMDERLTCMRKAYPRSAVPAGAVGIAGKQTGVYSLQTPAGWQIIGQTPIKLFDISKPHPSLLAAGDEVVFEPISLNQFNNLSGN